MITVVEVAKPKVFVSYSHKDEEWKNRFRERFKTRFWVGEKEKPETPVEKPYKPEEPQEA